MQTTCFLLTLILIAAPADAQRLTLESLAIRPPLSNAAIGARFDLRGWRPSQAERAENVRAVAALGNRAVQWRFLQGYLPVDSSAAQEGFRSQLRLVEDQARQRGYVKSLSTAKAAGLGAVLGLGATAVTNPEAFAEKGFWTSAAGSLAGGAAGAALATVARGTALWPVALAAPVVGGLVGGHVAAGKKVDWGRIGAHALTATAAALLLPASASILTGAAVMMLVSYGTDKLYDRFVRPAPKAAPGRALALLSVASQGHCP